MTTNIEYMEEVEEQVRIAKACVVEYDTGKALSRVPGMDYDLTQGQIDTLKAVFITAKNAIKTALDNVSTI